VLSSDGGRLGIAGVAGWVNASLPQLRRSMRLPAPGYSPGPVELWRVPG
jgi:hypothetical protein